VHSKNGYYVWLSVPGKALLQRTLRWRKWDDLPHSNEVFQMLPKYAKVTLETLICRILYPAGWRWEALGCASSVLYKYAIHLVSQFVSSCAEVGPHRLWQNHTRCHHFSTHRHVQRLSKDNIIFHRVIQALSLGLYGWCDIRRGLKWHQEKLW
jgi:hypothetical protein